MVVHNDVKIDNSSSKIHSDGSSFKENSNITIPEDLNPLAFRPYPPIQHRDDLWTSNFPRSRQFIDSLSTNEREKLLRDDYFDYKHAMSREKLIYEEETILWLEKLQKCKEKNLLHANSVCKDLQTIVNERSQYSNSKYSNALMPKLSPGLPDLGPKPDRRTYGLE